MIKKTPQVQQLQSGYGQGASAQPSVITCDPNVLWLPGLEPSAGERKAKPFLRWAGGKSRLMSALLPHFPQTFKAFHEPFLGAGAVFFEVRRRARRGCFLSDLNPELVNTFRSVRDNPEAFLQAIEMYRGRDCEKDYYVIRDGDIPQDPICRAAWFFYLNQTAWNGLWRVNRWGKFNVPWGARQFRGIPREELFAISLVLQSAEIDEVDFREALERPKRGDFVYLDPPYLPVSDTSKFSGYTEKRFRLASLIDLAETCEDLTRRGVHWVLSNRDTSAVRKLFSFARITALTTRRSVAAQNRRDVEPAASPELIIVGKV